MNALEQTSLRKDQAAEVIAFPAPAPRKRIAFVINSLTHGGAERVMDNLLHAAPEEWDLHLVLLDTQKEWRTPPSRVQIHRLDCKLRLLPSIRDLRPALEAIQPDLIVSFLVRANIASVIAARMLGVPCIISERSTLSVHMAAQNKGSIRRWAASLAPRFAYPRADHIVAVSEGVRSDLIRNFKVKPDHVSAIPNPYDLDRIRRDSMAEPEFRLPEKFILSAGRLVTPKGFGDLIEAYAMVRPEASLCIIGEGPERPKFEAQIAALGLQDKVHLLGYATNPFAIISRAEMFVSASYYEGFPNALAEAMALGVPIVSTDCPSGPAEILEEVETTGTTTAYNARYGILVPLKRPEVLAEGIRRMLDPAVRSHYSVAARKRLDAYRIGIITERYWDTFNAVLRARGLKSDH